MTAVCCCRPWFICSSALLNKLHCAKQKKILAYSYIEYAIAMPWNRRVFKTHTICEIPLKYSYQIYMAEYALCKIVRESFMYRVKVLKPVYSYRVNIFNNAIQNSLRRFIYLYYIYFEISCDPYNLIGSQQCDLFTNHTTFCSKSHLFPANKK